ncbi:MAG: hypothetical protein ABI298_07890 [Acidimicrobiales bacterium]
MASEIPGTSPFHRQLLGISYDDVGVREMIRFRDLPLDDTISNIVRSVANGAIDEIIRFRFEPDDGVVDRLRLFAKRRILQARRRSSIYLVDDAMDAYALLPTIDDVPWENWLKAGLFIARSLGRDLDAIAQRFHDVADEDVAARFDVAFESMARIGDLRQCNIVEVSTNYGTGMLRTLVFRAAATKGWGMGVAPRQGDNLVTYDPESNLAQLAVTLADAIDATGNLRTEAIAHDQIPAMLFSLSLRGSYLPVTGCLSFFADADDEKNSFNVFVAELPDDEEVEEIAECALGDDQIVFHDGFRLVQFVAPPLFSDDDNATLDFSAYADICRKALSATLPTGWSSL